MSLVYRLLLTTGLVLASPSAYARAQGAYQDAVNAFDQGDYRSAAAFAREATRSAPGHIPSIVILAQSYHSIFEDFGLYYSEAIAAYELLLSALPETTDAWSPLQVSRVLLGQLYLRGGDYKKGLYHLTEFLGLQPDHRDADDVWNSIGVAYYYQNEYESAVEAFEKAIAINPEFEPARFNLRSMFTRLGLFDQAMANLRLGRRELALEDLDSLLVMAPRYLPALVQKILILRDQGRDDEAEEAATHALSFLSDPQVEFELSLILGDIATSRGDIAEAMEHYRRCLRIEPGFLQVVEKINDLEAELARTRSGEPSPGAKDEAGKGPAVTTRINQFPM